MNNHQERFIDYNNLISGKIKLPASYPYGFNNDLIEVLCRHQARTLITIVAPAGFGKTSVVSRWIKITGINTAWISLDSHDNTFIYFIKYLIATLKGISENLGNKTEGILNSTNPDLSKAAFTLISEIQQIKSKFILVLDDYHFIKDPQIHELIQLLIQYNPGHIRLIIVSREKLPFPISKLKIEGRLTQIETSHLQLSENEIYKFFEQVHEIKLEQGHLEILKKKTEGWIAGLQLMAMTIKTSGIETINNSAGEINSAMSAYLLEEVMAGLPPAIQSFLIRSSILKSFNASICNAVLEQNNSDQLISWLDKVNLFIVKIDENDVSYRYHHLFLEYLSAKFNCLDSSEQHSLHYNASKWYHKQGIINEAMEHAFASSNKKWIISLTESNALNIILHGQIKLLLSWIERIDALELHTVMIKVWKAWVHVFSENLEIPLVRNLTSEIESELTQVKTKNIAEVKIHISAIKAFLYRQELQLEKSASLSLLTLERHSKMSSLLKGALLNNVIYAFYLNGETEKAQKYTKAANENCLSSANFYGLASAAYYESMVLISLGRMDMAKASLEKVYDTYVRRGVNYFPFTAFIYLGLAKISLETGDVNKTDEYINKADELSLSGGDTLSTHFANLIRIELMCLKTEKSNAMQAILRAEHFARQSTVSYWTTEIQLLKVRTLLFFEEATKANKILIDNEKVIPDNFNLLNEGKAMAIALLSMGNGETQNALEWSAWLQKHLRMNKREVSLGESLLLSASIYLQQKNEKMATDHLKEALEILYNASCKWTLLKYGKAIIPILKFARKNKIKAPWCHNFIVRIESFYKEAKPGLATGLSKRELEVVLLLKKGMTNKEIGYKLFISTGTVKRHVHNIIEKLEVKNRNQIASRIEELVVREPSSIL